MRRMNWFAAIAAASFTAAFAPAVLAADQIYAPNGVTVTTSSTGATVIQTPNVPDFTVLMSPKYDYTDLVQASDAGLSEKQIAVATKIAERTNMSFRDVVDAILRGETYSSLSDRTNIPLGDLYNINDQVAKIRTYKEAYLNTGTMGLRTMVKGARMVRYVVNGQAVIAEKDIVDLARNTSSLTMFSRAIRAADLEATLRGPGPFTIFAPSDSAFNSLPADYVNSLMNDKTRLRQVLQYHVLPTRVSSGTALGMISPTSSPTLEGSTFQVTNSSGNLMINSGRVIIPDMVATNGIIHIIDTVLTPPSLASTTPLPTTVIVPPSTTIIVPPSTTIVPAP